MWRAVAAAGLAGVATAAAAHPHGSLDCAVQLGVERDQLTWVEQRLTLDLASSQALMDRLQLDTAEPALPARLFRQVVVGLFRQSGWMLELRPAADTSTTDSGTGAPLVLDDTDDVRWRRDAEGRVVVEARLQVKPSPAPWPVAGLRVTCRDPVWYWVAGFRKASQLTASGAACTVQAGNAEAAGAQARALQAAALRAGAPNADEVAPGLLDAAEPRMATVQVNC